jgi:hypothetical protein
MIDLQQRIEALTGTTSNLIAQLRELERLRDRVRKAKLSARRLWRMDFRETLTGPRGGKASGRSAPRQVD